MSAGTSVRETFFPTSSHLSEAAFLRPFETYIYNLTKRFRVQGGGIFGKSSARESSTEEG
jgi:hypothetical protein